MFEVIQLPATASSVRISTTYVYTVVENLGLCVELTHDLLSFLNKLFYLQMALCTLGILGSLVALMVCVRRKLRSSCCVQLACLAVYDVLFLLACLLIAVLAVRGSWNTPAVKVFLCLRTLALWGATYTTLDICSERCLSVACPFLVHSRFTVGLALKRSALILLLGLCFTLPLILDLIYSYSVGDECAIERQLTTFGLVYTLYTSILLLYVLPFSAIIVINIIFVIILCRHRQSSVRPEGENTTAEHQLSVLVVGLSGWYAVSMLVPSLLFLVHLTRVELFQPNVDIRAAGVSDAIVVLSCCSNFVFYFLLWRPFRQVVWAWLAVAWGRLCGWCGGCRWLKMRARSYQTSSSDKTGTGEQYIMSTAPSPPLTTNKRHTDTHD